MAFKVKLSHCQPQRVVSLRQIGQKYSVSLSMSRSPSGSGQMRKINGTQVKKTAFEAIECQDWPSGLVWELRGAAEHIVSTLDYASALFVQSRDVK